MKKEDYINEVTALIKNRTAKKDIKKELEAHIDDRAQFYIDSGYDEDYSYNKAVEMMGNPKEVAKSLEKLHNNTLWIILSLSFLGLFVFGLIYADINITSFAYINMVDFTETDPLISLISVVILGCATASFYFAKKAKSVSALMAIGMTALISPIIAIYALRPAGYQFFSVFTDLPIALKTGEAFFSYTSEAFSLFCTEIGESMGGTVASFSLIVLMLLTIAFPLILAITGFLSIVYAGRLKHEEDYSECERRLKILTVVLTVVFIISIASTVTAVAHDKALGTKLLINYGECDEADISQPVELNNTVAD